MIIITNHPLWSKNSLGTFCLLWLLWFICFHKVDADDDDVEPRPVVESFTLFDAANDVELRPIVEGDRIEISTAVNIRADVQGDDIDNVVLSLNDGFVSRTENQAPYMLGGNTGNDIHAVPELQISGQYIVSAIAFGTNGQSSTPLSISFTIVAANTSPSSPNPSPSPLPNNNNGPTTTGEYDVPAYQATTDGAMNGELKKWHKITLGFRGPETSETANPNPFLYYRCTVTFTNQKSTYVVPGYYAADGNAANTRASSGNVWLVHFAPDAIGTWNWQASFLQGDNIAIVDDESSGTSAGYFDGASGSFNISASDKTGRDHRGKGRLNYVGKHHLQFAETGQYFLKAGADSPENFLAYEDFDGDPVNNYWIKNWAPHIRDYVPGDPTWAAGLGTGIMGAVNYLSGKGMNVFSFLPFSIEGDDKNVYPYISTNPNDFDRIDVSKTAQWEVVFEHADQKGMFMHFKTQETENDQLLDNGELGLYRKFYYRELVARFGHHLALNWNLGEENTNTDDQRKAFSDYIKKVDPYDHPVVMHTYPGAQTENFTPLLGHPTFDGASIQTGIDSGFSRTLEWITLSAAAGRPWIVSYDEQGPASTGVKPDSSDPQHNDIRKYVLWANIMAGGAGVEYYFGYDFSDSDLSLQDFRSRDAMWDQSRYALDFFSKNSIPFWMMANANEKLSTDDWLLMDNDGAHLVLYLRNGGTTTIDLSGISTWTYTVEWFDPFIGGDLQSGSILSVSAGSAMSVGDAPYNETQDWVVLVRCEDCDAVERPASIPTFHPSASKVPLASPIVVSTEAPTQISHLSSAFPTLSANLTNVPTASNALGSNSSTMVPSVNGTAANYSDSPTAPESSNVSSSPSQPPAPIIVRTSSPTFVDSAGQNAERNDSGISLGHFGNSFLVCMICNLLLFVLKC